jgi:hypothetical protein
LQAVSLSLTLVPSALAIAISYYVSIVGKKIEWPPDRNENETIAKRTQAPEQRLHELQAELAGLGFCLPGSLSTRQMRCGKTGCRCKADPPQLHGPYTYWTRTIGGRTVAQLLSAQQVERYRPWIENNRRLHQLVRELEALAVQTAQHAERWQRKRPPQTPARRSS